MIDGSVIKNMLCQRIKETCRHLLPNGSEFGGEWTASNVRDISSKTPGKNTGSLRVAMVGSKVGSWMDHGDPSQKGDILQLWMATRNVTFVNAVKESADFLGYRPVNPPFKKNIGNNPPPSSRPEKLDDKQTEHLKPIIEGSRPWKWLVEERKLSPETIRAYGIGQGKYPYDKDSPLCVIFPFIDSKGDLQMLKWRDPDNKAYIRTTAKSRKVLFGIPAVPENQSVMYITEGELDAMAMYEMGCPAVSVPYGAKVLSDRVDDKSAEWIEHDYDNFINFHTEIIFATDGDDIGREATESIARRLGRERCRVIEWPDGVKDANEYIMSGYDGGDFYETLLNTANNMDPKSLKTAKDYRQKIWECFWPSDESQLGDSVPFGGDQFPFALEWANRHFWIYDKVGTAKPDEVLEVFAYAVKKYGISHFVIDSLMRLDIPEDEDSQLKSLMNKLVDFANNYNVHVHLVAHSKKPDMKRPETKGWPNKHMVRGSVHITNIAHNVVVVWRNKAKEEAYFRKQQGEAVDWSKWEKSSDAVFAVLAQRENGEEPIRNLYFDKNSWQYLDRSNETPEIYAK